MRHKKNLLLLKDRTFAIKTILLFFIFLSFLSTKLFSEQSNPRPMDPWGQCWRDQDRILKEKLDRYKEENKKTELGNYIPGIVNSLEKVFQDPRWFKGEISRKVTLHSARNEYESFQLCLISLSDKDIDDIKIKLSDLKSKDGHIISRQNINYYPEGYVHTSVPNYPVPYVGYWPDILFESKSFSLIANQVQPIWIEFYIPEKTFAGDYYGSLEIVTEIDGNTKIDIHLKVWDFALPKEHVFRTTTWISPGRYYGKEQKLEMFRKYGLYFLEHKINPINSGKSFYKKDDYSTVSKNLELFISNGQSVFEIPRLKGEELIRYCNYLKKRSWFQNAMIYGYKDEPSESDYEAFRKDSENIKKAVPDLKIFIAESPHPGLYGAVDVWWASMATENRKYTEDCLHRGNEVWWYRCGIPYNCDFVRPYHEYPSNIVIDRPLIDIRILYWMNFKFKMSNGTFFYCGNAWPAQKEWPPIWNPVYISGSTDKFNGDGYIVYPGKNGPLGSLRLKAMRDGIEDYEYFYLLEKLSSKSHSKHSAIAKKLLKIPSNLIANTHVYSKAPEDFLAYRIELAKAIESLLRERLKR